MTIITHPHDVTDRCSGGSPCRQNMKDIELKQVSYKGDLPEPDYGVYNPAFKNDKSVENSTNGSDPDMVAIDFSNGKSGSFTPQAVQADRKDDHDDEDNCDDMFDDIDPPDVAALRGLKNAQDNFSKGYEKHKSVVWTTIGVIIVLLYFAYFIYAIIYNVQQSAEDNSGFAEGFIRLVWVTVLVVVCFIIYLIKRYLGDQISDCLAPCYEKVEPYGRIINWVFLVLLYLFIIIFIIVDVVIVSQEPYNLVSLTGVVMYVFFLFIFSYSPAHVSWRAVLWGLALQFIFAIVILRTWWGYEAFKWLGDRVSEFLEHTDAGSKFVFGEAYTNHFFAFKVLPVVIFFSTAISVLYYLGWMQVVIKKVAWVMQITMGTTAGESLNAAGNIFIGQSEAPLMIKPMLADMTRSEIHAVMTGGFATIAGSVLAAYILMGVPANHLISASVMSAPAALAMAKLFWPETQQSRTTVENIQEMAPSPDKNIVEAASNGASAAISLVANIGANLIAFIAMLQFINSTLTWFGIWVGLVEPGYPYLTLELILSYLLFPFAAAMGADVQDCLKLANLIGVKTILNEFIAYDRLGEMVLNMGFHADHVGHNLTTGFEREGVWLYGGADLLNTTLLDKDIQLKSNQAVFNGTDVFLTSGILTDRTKVIATYALCGFANVGSMGIMIGALSAMAPSRKRDISRIVVRAMIAGNVACFMTASIAGLFYQGEL